MTRNTWFAALALTLVSPAAAFAQMGGGEAVFHYQGEMEITPETGHVDLQWEITVFDDEAESLTFLLNPAYGDVVIDGAAVLTVNSAPAEAFGGAMNAHEITLAPAENGAPRVIRFDYAGRPMDPPPNHGINSITPRKAEFTVDSFWMPFDMRFSSPITAELEVDIPGDWAGVSTEPVERTETGFVIRQTRPSLDLAFTLMSDFVRHETPDYIILDSRETPGRGVEALQGALADCTAWLEDFAGPAGPLPRAAVTVNDRSQGGYSRATLIALTDISGDDPVRLGQFICHEFSHFWSRGNAMTVENWLNEAFADYTALMAVRAIHGEAAFERFMTRYAEQIEAADHVVPPIWTPGETDRGPYIVQYRKAPLALAWLEEEIGREAFATFIQRYMLDEIATTPDLLDLLEEVAGRGAREAFQARLAE